jgi:putative Holliday junction resolvase
MDTMSETARGRILGLDYGTKRIGVAMSDGLQIAASPLDVLDARAPDLIERIEEIVTEYEVVEIAVGLPTSLAGGEGPSADGARELAATVGHATGVPVVFVDERFTSRMAETSMLDAGVRRRDRRERVDKVAASIMLQSHLDRIRQKGDR